MNLQRLPTFAAIFLLVTCLHPPTLRAAENPNRPPELKILDRWIGDWIMESTVKVDNTQVGQVKFETSARWTIGNRFLQCDAQGKGTQGNEKIKAAFTWICTYDPAAKNYTSTSYWSNTGQTLNSWGGGLSMTGEWDEKSQTLTSKGTDAAIGITMVSTIKWIDADHHEFVRTLTDSAGKVVMEVTGKVKRKGTKL